MRRTIAHAIQQLAQTDLLVLNRKFCEFLNVKSLIKDDSSPDEYEEDAYFLIDRINIQRVYIDLDKIDDDLYLLK